MLTMTNLKMLFISNGYPDIINNPPLIKPEWRNTKLKIMLSEMDFEPNLDLIRNKSIFKQTTWDIIEKYKGKSIISGSIALKAFGLLERETSDLDLIAIDESIIKFKGEPGYNYGRHRTPTFNIIGYDNIKLKTLKIFTGKILRVDFFENKKQTIIEKDGFLFHSPIEIMDQKIEICSDPYLRDERLKDFEDFIVFNNLIEKRL